jgi:nicotinate dehydrogenase subunit B
MSASPRITSPGRGPTSISRSLALNPGVDTWLRIDAADTITIFTGKVEIGQGILSALARIAADELDVALTRIRIGTADTASGPDEGITAGSTSMVDSGNALRQAAAEARAHVLARAADALGAAPHELRLDDGAIVALDGTRTTIWDVQGGQSFGFDVRGDVAPKHPDEHRLVGRPGPRIDLEGLVFGTTRFVQDLAPPGLLHARVVQPPSPGAVLEQIDEERARTVPGVHAVVRDGGFVGVLAEREEHALAGLEALRASARWNEHESLPDAHGLAHWISEQPVKSFLIVNGAPVDDPIGPIEVPDGAVTTLAGTFTRPYQMHASIGPSAALAEWRDGLLTVWTHSQEVPLLRMAIAEALELDAAAVRVLHVPGPGCYGHNGADDAAFEASLLARAIPDRPVLLKWTREDEHTGEPYAPAAVVTTSASLDAEGRLLGWNLDAQGQSHNARPFAFGARTALAAAWRLERPRERKPVEPLLIPEAGIHRNATPIYRLPQKRIVKHLVSEATIRTSSTRALGAFVNVFAIESLMDELAEAAGKDPLDFRLAHLDDPRARDVLEAAAERSGWRDREPEFGRGMGIGFARYKNSAAYAAVIVDVTVDDETAQITVNRAVIGADAGEIVDPEGLANQLEGGVVQATSWALEEEVTFDRTRITSVDWDTYPILRFPAMPLVDTVLIDRPGQPYLGAGEATQGPTGAAIANAVREAIGVGLRDFPFTPERVREAVAGG